MQWTTIGKLVYKHIGNTDEDDLTITEYVTPNLMSSSELMSGSKLMSYCKGWRSHVQNVVAPCTIAMYRVHSVMGQAYSGGNIV